MKQSYSLTIADMALDITTDASPEELENIVGILFNESIKLLYLFPACGSNGNADS